jgi:hypothetical protein
MSLLAFRPSVIAGMDRRRLALSVGFALLSAAALALVALGAWQALGPDGSRDNQWSGAHVLWLGLDPSQLFTRCRTAGCASDPFIHAQYPNYPISALMMLLPFGALPWSAAKIVWLGVNLASTAALFWCARTDLAPRLSGRLLAFACLVFLVSTPYRNHLGNGQQGIFALAMFALALRSARRGHPDLAGVLLAASWLKFTLTLPLSLVFVARRDWRAIGIAVALHVILTLAAAAWTGTGLIASTFGFFEVARLAVDVRYGFLDVFGIAVHFHWPEAVAMAASAAFAAAGLALAWRLRPESELPLLGVAGLLAMAAFYHLSYDCVIFFLPLLYALDISERGGKSRSEQVFAALALAVVAMTWIVNRVVEGNNVGYEFGTLSYRNFYWAMAAVFYAAIVAGLFQLWKIRSNLTWAESFAMSRGSRPAK